MWHAGELFNMLKRDHKKREKVETGAFHQRTSKRTRKTEFAYLT